MKQTTRSRRTVVRHLADLTADPQNANRGTPRGRAALAHSLRDYGAGRARIQSLDDLQPDPFNANRGTDRGRADLRDDHVNVPTAPEPAMRNPFFLGRVPTSVTTSSASCARTGPRLWRT